MWKDCLCCECAVFVLSLKSRWEDDYYAIPDDFAHRLQKKNRHCLLANTPPFKLGEFKIKGVSLPPMSCIFATDMSATITAWCRAAATTQQTYTLEYTFKQTNKHNEYTHTAHADTRQTTALHLHKSHLLFSTISFYVAPENLCQTQNLYICTY